TPLPPDFAHEVRAYEGVPPGDDGLILDNVGPVRALVVGMRGCGLDAVGRIPSEDVHCRRDLVSRRRVPVDFRQAEPLIAFPGLRAGETAVKIENVIEARHSGGLREESRRAGHDDCWKDPLLLVVAEEVEKLVLLEGAAGGGPELLSAVLWLFGEVQGAEGRRRNAVLGIERFVANEIEEGAV